MRRIPFFACQTLLVLILLKGFLLGQGFDYGHDWYTSDPNRTFIKILVWEDGLYRLHPSDFSAAGHSISQVSPSHFQLWYRGEEQPIHVAEDLQGELLFIEFLGKRNDGQLDSVLYRNPVYGIREDGHQPHPEISLFSDTSAYFLSWDGSNGVRYQTSLDTAYSSLPKQFVYPYESLIAPHPDSIGVFWVHGGSSYDAFYTLNTDYVTGEGYAFPFFHPLSPYSLDVATPAAANLGAPKTIRVRLFARSNTAHYPKVSLNGTVLFDTSVLGNSVFINDYVKTTTASLPATSSFLFESTATGTDNHHLNRISIRYNRLPTLLGETHTRISQWQHPQPAYFALEQSLGTDSLWIIDPTLQQRISGRMSADTAHVILPGHAQARDLWLFTDQAIQTPSVVPQHKLSNLCAPDSGAQFLIIAHRDLATSAMAYAQYRDSNSINSFSSKVVFTDQIYDEFGYGSPTSWAIKRFINCAIENWTSPPEYILMWGKGHYRMQEYGGPIVPVYGFPGSDLPYVEPYLPLSTTILPQVAIGRVNLSTNAEGLVYLAKMDEAEHSLGDWQRKGLFLGGGATSGEQNAISTHLQQVANVFSAAPLHGLQRSLNKTSISDSLWLTPDSIWINIDNSTLADDSIVSAYVDSGLGWIQFFGHSTANLQEIPLGEAVEYGNMGRYPFMMMMGCYSSNPAATVSTYTERWMFEPGRGSIGYLSTTTAAYLNPLRDYSAILLPNLVEQFPGTPIGEVVRQSVMTYTDSLAGIQYRNHARSMMLFCDPAYHLFSSPTNPALTAVWPGDANNDGIANMVDLLNIGLGFGQTGSIRPGNLNWYAQPTFEWTQTFEGGTNYKHADADGDGWIRAADTLGISLNYGLTHNKTEEDHFTTDALPIYLVYPDSITEGDTIQIEVYVGDETTQDSLYGIALQLQFDPDIVQDNLVWVHTSPNWLGSSGQNLLTMSRSHLLDGWVDLAFTRTNHVDTIGHGKLADISIVITDDIAKKERAAFHPLLSYGKAVKANGEKVSLTGISTSHTSIGTQANHIQVYPNPASDWLHISGAYTSLESVELIDAAGRRVYHSTGPEHRIFISDWPAGIYLIRAGIQDRFLSRKIVIR
ncbi:MAG: C25 family cysteine peptidase [Bacteroidota bacterium]